MERNFSRIIMMVGMLLFATSSAIEGAANIAGAAGKLVFKNSDEFVEQATKKILGESSSAAAMSMKKLLSESLENAAKALGKNSDDYLKLISKSADNGTELSVNSINDVFGKASKISEELTKAGKNFKQIDELIKQGDNMTVGTFSKKVDELLPDMSMADRAALKSQFKNSKGVLTSSRLSSVATDVGHNIKKAITDLPGSAKNIMGKSDDALSRLTKEDADAALRLRKDLLDGTIPGSGRQAAVKKLAELEYKAATNGGKVLRRLSAVAGSLAGPGNYVAIGMFGAILFMVPTFFQSMYIAQQHHIAMLETYTPPTQFGNIVMQLPDSVIDMTNPIGSQFVYYGIPVSNPGEKLSAQAKAAYPGVSDPTIKNKVSQEVHNYLAQAFSGGGVKKIDIPRYNLDAQALATLPIFVSYSEQTWQDWASNGIPDAAFSQSMINLNTGYIFYSDGTSNGVPAAHLVGNGPGKTVQMFMAKKHGLLKNTGSTAVYRDFIDAYSTAKADKVASSVLDQFDCKCLEGGILSADIVQKCSGSKTSTCLLSSALNQLAAGVVINSQGTVMRADQDLATEIANGALGQIIPIQGYADKFDDILRLFPGAEKQALANSGALTVSLGANLTAASADVVGALADNYAAKGVYVYQCKNTPLAKMLRNQTGGAGLANEYVTDFIVFLDQDLNQVPLMVPVRNPKNYNFISMNLNPAIKYFSTIIGSLDANGGFSFLPQLNIQSPAALTAKGLPATFAPLYGLQATNGALAVNYNQNLSSTIGGIAQALVSNAKLGQQFKMMQSALLTLLTAGPFGKYQLSPVAKEMQPMIGGVQLVMYSGFNSYPVAQGAANAACSDLLIPISAAGKTVTLPSNNVTQYYGLVTDLTYSVRPDGTIAVDPTGFTNSPLSQSLTIDQKAASQFYWMNKLTAMGQNSNPDFALPDDLVSYVTQARQAWINWIAAHGSNNATKSEFAGINVAGTSMMLTIANQQILDNGLYIYTASPCPSKQTQDYFVLVNSSSPQANDAKLGSLSALSANSGTNMISLVSGLLYNMSGAQVKNSIGVAYSVNVSDLLQALNNKYPKALSDDFKAKLNIVTGQAAIVSQALVYPFNFGGLQLGIYQADLDKNVNLYVDASGAAASANFVPSDYFVTINSLDSLSQFATPLSKNTPYIVSLVSGTVYDQNGVQSVLPASQLAQLINYVSPSWRSGIAQKIASLTAALAATVQNQQKETEKMNAAPLSNSGSVTFDKAKTIIANITQSDYLPAPYDMLKQDPASGMYVLVTPANAQGDQFLYTFFDVANSFVDGNGSPVHVGASYDDQGNILRVIRGFERATLLRQYGVAVDSTGHQYLGAQNSLPAMPLDPADLSLKPGVSGKSMIYSNDPQFPSFGIVSPISYLNSKFYIYFNLITQAYYAMQVTGNDICYIDMAGGSVYNLDGSSRIDTYPVAINKNGDISDLLLPYANPDGFIRCVMRNSANQNLYSDYLNLQDSFQVTTDPATHNSCGLNALVSMDDAATNVQIAQMPFDENLTSLPDVSAMQQYNVYVDGSSQATNYVVSAMYSWQDLQLLPIDMTNRAWLKSMPDPVYQYTQLILKNNAPYACIFAGQLYGNVESSAAGVYTMTSGNNKIIASMKVDVKTNVTYVELVANNVTYNYQFLFKKLTDAQLRSYRSGAWQSEVIADVTGKIVLEKYLPADDQGNVQLSPVTMKSLVNAPSDAAILSALQRNLAAIKQDSLTGRFIAAVGNDTYPYFTQDGYVDLENGILFDASGLLVGYTLQFADLIAILNQLSVSVVRNSSNQTGLRYRPSAQTAQAAQVAVQSYAGVEQNNQARSTLLGRFSSKKAKRKSRKNK